jgi:hypothetical protein
VEGGISSHPNHKPQGKTPDIQDPQSNYASELQNYFSIIVEDDNLVALQLAELKRASMMSAAKIRQVIQSLPPTLDAFYERSILDINSFQSEQAHTLLQ